MGASGRYEISFSQRLKAHWLLKAVGTTAVITVFLVFYLYLLKNPIFRVTEMPLTALDRMIDFQPAALALYVSLWVYVGLPPALIETRGQLLNYGWAAGVLCTVGLGIFLIWPTAVPPTDIDWGRYPGFGYLKQIDGAGNACPSLHVATAIYSAIWLERLLRDMGRGAVIRFLSGLWCIGIVYSALATKQHVAVDALGGAVLGNLRCSAFVAAWRRYRGQAARASALRLQVSASGIPLYVRYRTEQNRPRYIMGESVDGVPSLNLLDCPIQEVMA